LTRGRLLVGTRGSRLALAQTNLVLRRLEEVAKGVKFEVVPIRTAGDVQAQSRKADAGGKTAFTGEIERQLLESKIDLAVHSMKDLPSKMDEELAIGATPQRGDPRDALVTKGARLQELRKGARVGTSSPRRRAQLLSARRDLEVVELHGNVETRLGRLESESLDGVVLAAAGLERLGLQSRITQLFATDELVPAPCQGVLAVQARKGDVEVLSLLKRIDDAKARAASYCERAYSEALGGDCDVPLGAFASVGPGGLAAVGVLADPEGESLVKRTVRGEPSDPLGVGRELAAEVIGAGGRQILKRMGR
jgi:hydroxymethylbilane synthase